VLFRNAPQRAWNAKEIHLLRFCGMLFQDVSRFWMVLDKPILNRIRHFLQVNLIFG
jgi:hypothetical protein